jgi:histidyl-tRNA synthetase
MKSQKCKGMRDLLPGDMQKFRFITDIFSSRCLGWGYREVRTPTLEYLHLFTATGTLSPVLLGKVYSFLDWDGWSGERVVLRPDGTIPVVRLYIESLKERGLAKLFYTTDVFAFEGTGREDRQRWQCGVELLGDARQASDVEIIALAAEVLRGLGLPDFELRLSNAGVVRQLVKSLGLEPGAEAKLMGRVLEGDWEALAGARMPAADLAQAVGLLTSLKGRSAGFIRNLVATYPNLSEGLRASLDEFGRLAAFLDALGIAYTLDMASLPGFEYYTGPCFQFLVKGRKVGGGGRYDNLVPLMGGGDVPACGFALYLDQLISLLPVATGVRPYQGALVLGSAATPAALKLSFELAASLRNAGYVAELDFSGQAENPWRWAITVEGEGQQLTVADLVQDTRKKVPSAADAVNLLGV